MNPLNFYIHPNDLDYERDVDEVGRDLIKQINQTNYLRTTMYCSGHFDDEQEYPWKRGELTLCMVVINNELQKAVKKLIECTDKLWAERGMHKVRGTLPYAYYDQDDKEAHFLVNMLVSFETKEERQKIVDMLKETLI